MWYSFRAAWPLPTLPTIAYLPSDSGPVVAAQLLLNGMSKLAMFAGVPEPFYTLAVNCGFAVLCVESLGSGKPFVANESPSRFLSVYGIGGAATVACAGSLPPRAWYKARGPAPF